MSVPGHIAPAEAAEAALAAEKHRSRARRLAPAFLQLAGFVAALSLVIGVMAAWAWAQDPEQRYPIGRLLGELLFLTLVIWWGISVVSSLIARLTRAIHPAVEIPAISTGQALVWAAVTVVAVPMAIQLRPAGFIAPVVVSAGCATGLWIARRRSKRIPNQPLCFSVVVGAIALAPLALIAAGPAASDEGLAPPTTKVQGAETLAADLRPLLYFDNEEEFRPVNVDEAKAEVCQSGRLSFDCNGVADHCENQYGTRCGAEALRDTWVEVRTWDFIRVTEPNLTVSEQPGRPNSAIYHHVWQDKASGTVYVDYWWYFAHNPAPVLRSVLCGEALTRGWLGAACAEHPADWEGLTLVLVPDNDCTVERVGSCVFHRTQMHPAEAYRISGAHYAQHEKVVTYTWEELQQRWQRPDVRVKWKESRGRRPLVFVARDSHASYAEPCEKCPQLVHTTFDEGRDGGVAWTNNSCRRMCVLELPVGPNGEPSRWNAFAGRWGSQYCILLESYCDSQKAPKAPAYQPRYKEPCTAKRDAEHCMKGPPF